MRRSFLWSNHEWWKVAVGRKEEARHSRDRTEAFERIVVCIESKGHDLGGGVGRTVGKKLEMKVDVV